MICNGCMRGSSEANPLTLHPDLTVTGSCNCGDQYAIKADWVLFTCRYVGFTKHKLHTSFLPQRIDENPSLNEKKRGIDLVMRNYHELMDCRDAMGYTFDEAITACLVANRFGVVPNTCECKYCKFTAECYETF